MVYGGVQWCMVVYSGVCWCTVKIQYDFLTPRRRANAVEDEKDIYTYIIK